MVPVSIFSGSVKWSGEGVRVSGLWLDQGVQGSVKWLGQVEDVSGNQIEKNESKFIFLKKMFIGIYPYPNPYP